MSGVKKEKETFYLLARIVMTEKSKSFASFLEMKIIIFYDNIMKNKF